MTTGHPILEPTPPKPGDEELFDLNKHLEMDYDADAPDLG